MLCSCGGETCTAAKPAGPRFCSHSLATSVHFHSNRWTNTSPADICPLARYVCASAGRSTGSWPVIGGPAVEPPQLVAASTRSAMRVRGRVDDVTSESQCRSSQPARRRGLAARQLIRPPLRLVARILLELRIGHEL